MCFSFQLSLFCCGTFLAVHSPLSQVLVQTSNAPTWVSRIQMPTRRIALQRKQPGRHIGGVRGVCMRGDHLIYRHSPFQNTRLFLQFNCGLFFFFLKSQYFFRQAMLQPEFGWSKADESHSEQSETETRNTAFCSSETLKSYAGDWPTVTGCPVSNPDNNCANGLLTFKSVHVKELNCFQYQPVHFRHFLFSSFVSYHFLMLIPPPPPFFFFQCCN